MLTHSLVEVDGSDGLPVLVGALRARLEDVLLPLLPQGARFALLDYPNHENVGDAAIWAGERAFLAAHGRDIVYVSDLQSYSARRLRSRLGSDGVILLHGGGNFGDLYPHHQRHRESVIAEFREHPIVQLPQTATFADVANVRRAGGIYGQHDNLTLLLRDAASLRFVREHFSNPSYLAPDSALALSLRRREGTFGTVLWLARTDAERAVERSTIQGLRKSATVSGDVLVTDWVGKRSARPPLVAWRQAVLLTGYAQARLRAAPMCVDDWLARSYDSLALRRVRVGALSLSRGQVVVTDRLHGHILALLLNIPHVLLNDRYDKVGRFYRTWSAGHGGVKLASTPEQALSEALALRESYVT
jgi:pyruvyl transferase EpsO